MPERSGTFNGYLALSPVLWLLTHKLYYILNTKTNGLGSSYQLVPGDKNYFESRALDQLLDASGREGVCKVVGYPDLHPGKGIAVGAAVISRGYVYPFFIGGDIGCGMGLWKTSMKKKKVKLDRVAKRLAVGMNDHRDAGSGGFFYGESLGTIGGGNHFAELQSVEEVFDEERAEMNGVDRDRVHLLIHSGSRAFGESVLRNHTSQFGADGLRAQSPEGLEYVSEHDCACRWAKENRRQIAERVASSLGLSLFPVSDVSHNSISSKVVDGSNFWIHRKGAAAADEGAVVISGTRGSLSYLVEPIDECDLFAWSLSHGAGRKWQRSECKDRLRERFRKSDLVQTELGGRVLCEDKNLLYEEAPQAYKNVDTVIGHLVDAGMIRIIASFRPLVTFKEGRASRRLRKERI